MLESCSAVHPVVIVAPYTYYVASHSLQGVIFSMRFSSDASRLVSVSDDRTVRVWHLPAKWRMLVRYSRASFNL